MTPCKCFDPAKPVQTRSGGPARILITDRKDTDGRSIAFLRLAAFGDDLEVVDYAYPDGRRARNDETPWDLVNIPEKKTLYVNVFKGEKFWISGPYTSEDGAKKWTGSQLSDYLGTFPITVEL
jgi:hypothetical protein